MVHYDPRRSPWNRAPRASVLGWSGLLVHALRMGSWSHGSREEARASVLCYSRESGCRRDCAGAFMQHQFEFTFDVPFIRNALRRDFLWKGYLIAGLMLVCVAVARWIDGYFEPWLTGVLVFGSTLMVWRIHAMLQTIAGRIFDLWTRMAPDQVIRYELDDQGFEVVLQQSRSRHEWAGLRRLWRCSDVWLIEIVKKQSTFFPPDQAPEEPRGSWRSPPPAA